ncbi:hypothetical protein [Niameybacter massiliensis]|uniref:hypothetical protein n=1 Tax=Niameybacter massiliensis TaxID=1658108 RepID=UPI0006B5E41C|nr:hypothetical protein [Niameybacter massiliensis]
MWAPFCDIYSPNAEKKGPCNDCLCTTCYHNAENHADGMCRECECCREDRCNLISGECKGYEQAINQ